MDQIKNQNLQTVGDDNLKKSQFLKKTLIQFLLSVVSIFSFVLSYYSWLPFSLNGYLSVLSFHLLNYTIDRKYMFLLCNGILVFLARNSYFFSSSTDLHDKLATRNVDQFWLKPEFSEMIDYVVEKEVVVESVGSLENNILENEDGEEVREGQKEAEEDEKNGTFISEDNKEEEKRVPIEEEDEEENGILISEEDNKEDEKRVPIEEEEEEEGGGGQEEEEEDAEEENGSLSTEELNKKFDEFIKKMKEGIRIEAQEQLVFV
ncbi:hypothetical protein BVC80_1663g43 [Macleaya cordata]|uniref:Transmembrane protein n=1 Tax=Macleaya cordata TaxID=56857 RepID=A0A200RBQ6_MACCD|nr:hypothetical protein BVC80_1663g43 [Macleaya cordata]